MKCQHYHKLDGKLCDSEDRVSYVDGFGFLCFIHLMDWEWERVVIPRVCENYSIKFGGGSDRSFW